MRPPAIVVYTAKTHTRDDRETGWSRSCDGRLDLRFSSPGSARIGANPEQLLAAGWSASFASAIATAAQEGHITPPVDVIIKAEVDLIFADGGYVLATRLCVHLSGLAQPIAKGLVDEAENICPYSKAARGNVRVTIKLE